MWRCSPRATASSSPSASRATWACPPGGTSRSSWASTPTTTYVPGHPVAYKTSDNFLRCFGLSSLDDLPPLVRDNEDKQVSLFDEENDHNMDDK